MRSEPATLSIDFKLHPKQLQAFCSFATDELFGGATRGGKSYLTRASLITWCTEIPNLQCFIYRKYYDDVISNHMEGKTGFKAMLAEFQKAGLVRITENQIRWVQNGSLISLEHCSTDDAVEKAQGVPKNVLVLEEVCQIKERHIRFLKAWVSMDVEAQRALPAKYIVPKEYWREPNVPEYCFPRTIQTGNPIGASMGYFRRNFVKAAPEGKIWRAPDDEGGGLRQYIEAKVEDNPDENAALVRARVAGLGDKAMTSALVDANWDAPVGDFFPQYDDKRHSTPNFKPPAHWFKFRVFDWGMSDPFAVLWFCVSDGEGFYDQDNRKRWFRRGALICYREWYGCSKEDPAKGCEMRNESIAQGILDRTYEDVWGLTLCDSKPFQDVGMGEGSNKYKISDVFKKAGVPLLKANTARVTGWAQVKDRLIGVDGDPMILFCDCCVYTRDYLPALGRDKANMEDAEDTGEATHTCFVKGTEVLTPYGPRKIENLITGDYITSGDGANRRCSFAGMTKRQTKVVTLKFSSGYSVTCTPDHKFLTTEGWKEAIDCKGYACIIGPWTPFKYPQPSKILTELNIFYLKAKDIFLRTAIRLQRKDSTLPFGSITMGPFGKDLTSTIKIKTPLTIPSEILNASTDESIKAFTGSNMRRYQPSNLIKSGIWQRLGIQVQKASSGIGSITKKIQRKLSVRKSKKNAGSAIRNSGEKLALNSAQTNANLSSLATTDFMISKRTAPSVVARLEANDIARQRLAASLAPRNIDICESVEDVGYADVFCPCEPITGSFQLSNGLVVSNSDCVRYACSSRPLTRDLKKGNSAEPDFHHTITPASILKQLKREASQRRPSRYKRA